MKPQLLPLVTVTLALFFAQSILYADTPDLSEEARAENFSHKRGLALDGYDPVAYFNKGPTKGSKKITYIYRGVTYRFADRANLETFKSEPLKYEPQFGAWCAWAMYDGGGRTKANPQSYKIVDGKLYVFYDGLFGDTLEMWNEKLKQAGEQSLITDADKHWHDQVGQ